MERPLGAVERALWQLDRAAPLNFTTVAQVRGPLRPSTLRAGLSALQSRHPYLQVSIVVEPREPWFRSSGHTLGLRMVEAGGQGERWEVEAQRELCDPFDVSLGPLARCVWVREAPEQHTLLLTIHHAIADGLSGVYLMRDLIAAMGLGRGVRLERLSDPIPIEERYPQRARGLSGWLRRVGRLVEEGAQAKRSEKPVTVRYDHEVAAHELRARVIHTRFDAAFVKRLRARARSERTTVHGVLSAAMILGVMQDREQSRARVTFGSPVNLRRELSPAVGEEVGCFVSLVRHDAEVDADAGLWPLARALRAHIEAAQRRGTALTNLGLLPFTVKLFGGEQVTPQALVAKWRETVPMTGVLTNLGRLPIETAFGALTITSMHFVTAPCAMGDLVATGASLHGELYWNFVCPVPSLSEPHARSLVDGIVTRIRDAVEHEGERVLPAEPPPAC